ncbi:MAG: DUF480 domain-containing protein [Desulfatitalea sp.]|nr:DUF480 domain-containing protein [Desulfatitalea sp.]
MEIPIDEREARVLGCLMEKQLATPEYYPLSLNALTNACNQKSNRDPVVAWDESGVEEIAESLIQKKMVNKSLVGRVPKFEELFTGGRNLVPREAAVLCELLVRGPQTPGELRGRATRLAHFDNVEELLATLANLESWNLALRLARLPGHKESRYAQLLTGPPLVGAETRVPAAEPVAPGGNERLEALEAQVQALNDEIRQLRSELESFKKQFA